MSDEEATFMGVPRKRIDWCPRISDACNDCGECLKFCPHNVLEEITSLEGDKKVGVKNPENCAVFCRACQRVCPVDAISFPDKKETLAAIKKIEDERKP